MIELNCFSKINKYYLWSEEKLPINTVTLFVCWEWRDLQDTTTLMDSELLTCNVGDAIHTLSACARAFGNIRPSKWLNHITKCSWAKASRHTRHFIGVRMPRSQVVIATKVAETVSSSRQRRQAGISRNVYVAEASTLPGYPCSLLR